LSQNRGISKSGAPAPHPYLPPVLPPSPHPGPPSPAPSLTWPPAPHPRPGAPTQNPFSFPPASFSPSVPPCWGDRRSFPSPEGLTRCHPFPPTPHARCFNVRILDRRGCPRSSIPCPEGRPPGATPRHRRRRSSPRPRAPQTETVCRGFRSRDPTGHRQREGRRMAVSMPGRRLMSDPEFDTHKWPHSCFTERLQSCGPQMKQRSPPQRITCFGGREGG